MNDLLVKFENLRDNIELQRKEFEQIRKIQEGNNNKMAQAQILAHKLEISVTKLLASMY